MSYKVFIDTNILVSAIVFPYGGPARAYEKASHAPYSMVTCTTVVAELEDVFKRKFPKKLDLLDAFWAIASEAVEVVATPEAPKVDEAAIRDVKDRPILRAAMACGAVILVTGDKDFLESGLETPRIITAAEFLEL